MGLNEELVVLDSNDYYQITCTISEKKDVKKWLASIRVVRKDTGEFIKSGFTVFDSDKNELMVKVTKKVNESLSTEIFKLGRPNDWNSDIRRILMLCKRLQTEVGEFGSYAIDELSHKDIEDNYLARYSDFWRGLVKQSVSLGSKIQVLSPDDKIVLLTLPEDVLTDPSDAWSLAEIDARLLAFDFFINPTEREKAVHADQKKRLSDRFSELGWK